MDVTNPLGLCYWLVVAGIIKAGDPGGGLMAEHELPPYRRNARPTRAPRMYPPTGHARTADSAA